MLWEDNYLAHYGVKGMRWGVRKAIDTDSVYSARSVYPQGVQVKTPQKIQMTQQARAQKVRSDLTSIQASLRNSSDRNQKIGPKDTTGRFGKGNIDLNKRKVVRNKDGSISTEKSFSVNIDGKETLLPTVINGRVVTEDEAIAYYEETGEHLGQFDSVEEAEKYAEMLHNRQDWYYNDYVKTKGNKVLEEMLGRRREAEAAGKRKFNATEEMAKRRAAAEAAGKGKFNATEEMAKRRAEAEKKKKQK